MNQVWLLKQMFHKGFTGGYRYGALFGAIYGSLRGMQSILAYFPHSSSDFIGLAIMALLILAIGAIVGALIGLTLGAAVGTFAGMFLGIAVGRLTSKRIAPASYRTLLISVVTLSVGVLTIVIWSSIMRDTRFNFSYFFSYILYIINQFLIPAALAMIAAQRASAQALDWYARTAEAHAALEESITKL